MSDKSIALPSALLSFLPDSEFEVLSWENGILRIKVTKEIGPEEGILEFFETSHVCLQPRLLVNSIRIGTSADLPQGFFENHRPSDQNLDLDETIYEIDGAWGERFFVIAKAIKYSIYN